MIRLDKFLAKLDAKLEGDEFSMDDLKYVTDVLNPAVYAMNKRLLEESQKVAINSFERDLEEQEASELTEMIKKFQS